MAYKQQRPLAISEGGTASTSLTQYNVLVGNATSAITPVAPSATSGVPLISQGSSADPVFGTTVVAGGGTGLTSTTAYAVLCGGTTSTGNLQSVSGVGTSGQVLTSNGAGALPTWQSAGGGSGFSSINIQTFTTSGTYTPTPGMSQCIVEILGGGGGGAGTGTIEGVGVGAGGGAAGYCKAIFNASTIGGSQNIVIGVGGAGGTSSPWDGASGTATTFGALLTANGGGGAIFYSPEASSPGGTGGTASGGFINMTGNAGGAGSATAGNQTMIAGNGGNTIYGSGGPSLARGSVSPVPPNGRNGENASGYGSGGGGGIKGIVTTPTKQSFAGGDGAPGVCIITEYIA